MRLRIGIKAQLAVGLSVIATCCAAPVMAQDSAAGAQAQTAGSDEATTGLAEIIVTAQKRGQSLLSTPVAVTAFNEQSLTDNQIHTVNDLISVAPSFHIVSAQNKVSNSPLSIRGIGTVGTNPSFEGSVGIYIDGVYRSRPGMALSTFNDIGDLQILRGPQGTLFGKNTTAGALLINSATPTFSNSAGAELTVGNYSAVRASGFVNAAVNDDWAVRVSGVYDRADGFWKNPVSGQDDANTNTRSIKIQSLMKPAPGFTVRIIGDYADAKERCCYARSTRADAPNLNANPLDAFYASLAAAHGLPYYAGNGSAGYSPFDRQVYTNSTGQERSKDGGLAVDMKLDLSDATSLRSISAYRKYINRQANGDADFGPVDIIANYRQRYEIETFSQEFNLVGSYHLTDSLKLDTVLGGYYSHENLQANIAYDSGADTAVNALLVVPALAAFGPGVAKAGVTVANTKSDQTDVTKAIFGHATLNFDERFAVQAGLRYSDERKTLDRTNLINSDPFGYGLYLLQNQAFWAALGASTTGPDRSDQTRDKEWTYNVGAQFFPRPGMQFYVSYNRGFKAGGLSLNNDAGGQVPCIFTGASNCVAQPYTSALLPLGKTAAAPISYKPEFVNAYEIGFKTSYANRRGRLALTAFRSDFSNVQFSVFTGTAFATNNGDKARSQGIEVENTFEPVEGLVTNFAATYLDKAGFTGTQPPPGIVAGSRFPNAPKFSASGSVAYEKPVSSALKVRGVLSGDYSGNHSLEVNTGQDLKIANSFVVGASLSLASIDDRFSFTLFYRNCFQEEYYALQFSQPFYFSGDSKGKVFPVMVNTNAPRTFGVTLRGRM